MFPVWAGSGPRSWSAALVRRVQYHIRFVQIAIDQNIIVDTVILNLSARIPQPPFDHWRRDLLRVRTGAPFKTFGEGARINTVTASANLIFNCLAPCTSMSSTTSFP